MNSLFCIGCDQYDLITRLDGAEKDAKEMYAVLSESGFYEKHLSKLILSPTSMEVAHQLSAILRHSDIDTLTFFFAGHACAKDGSFFLALRDSDCSAMSATSFPLTRFFEMVNEFKPRHVNIIIDGCEAGSSMVNVDTLLKPNTIGTLHGSGVSFLGACAANQDAGESDSGGILTTHILNVLRGHSTLVLSHRVISLLDFSEYVAEKVYEECPDQQPVWWGLNLFGNGGIAFNANLHIDPNIPQLSLAKIGLNPIMRNRLANFSSRMWEQYYAASKNFKPRELSNLVNELLSCPDFLCSDRISIVSGMIDSFCRISKADGELFSRLHSSVSILCSLLPWSDDPDSRPYLKEIIQTEFYHTKILLNDLFVGINENNCRILSSDGFYSDLYFLPLRVTRLLGLIGMIALTELLLDCPDDQCVFSYYDMVVLLLNNYPKCFVALSDEQAAPLYIFIKAALALGWHDQAQIILESYDADAAQCGGLFTRLNSDGEGALQHILTVTESEFRGEKRMHANPSSLIPVILFGGIRFNISENWNLQAFDRRQIGLYFPDDYRSFNQEVICNGKTHTWQIGFGVWKVSEFESEFRNILNERADDSKLSPEAHVLCMMAALIFPDRIPLCLESIL
jgi:hypothetical protein